ncbi:hypothetical protein [Dyadobacter tibetensis]|uniref:hypothetical protein n=1 Tax=Dyadobacter tibetensis TaxID=1211851 RepID=UPI00046EA439|nr:hypothetical protein [Dyadobacter tibetensis]
MKKQQLIYSLIALCSIFFYACSGSQGPIGPQGPQGEPGDSYIGQAFNLKGVNFTKENQYRFGLRFSDAKVEVLESDVVLVYIHWDDQKIDDQILPAWRLLPQTELIQNGTLIYNFDRTKVDFSVFLRSSIPLANLGAGYTQNQNFRIVIIPADFIGGRTAAIDYSDYQAVAKAYHIDETKIVSINN